jgi:anti-sigma factor RsiW
LPEPAPMPCQELVEVLTAYLDASLPASDRERLEAHLELCDPCIVYIEQFRETIARIGNIHAHDLPPATQDALLRVFRGWNAA